MLGDLLLVDAVTAPRPDAGVRIRDGVVAEIGDGAELRRAHPDADVVGGPGMLVLPGLINAHHHGMGISTVQLGFPDPGPPEPGRPDTAFETWMASMLLLDAIDPYLGTLYKNALLIESGVTSHVHMHFPGSAGQAAYAAELEQTLRAHRDAGQRVLLAPHHRDRSRLAYDGDDAFIAALPSDLQPAARAITASPMSNEEYVATIEDLARSLRDDPLVGAQLAIMAPQWASDELVGQVADAASGLGVGVHLHSLESPLQRAWGDRFGGGRELQHLADLGVLNERAAIAHGVFLRDSDIELLARTGSTVVHNASSNLRLAVGIAPLRQLVAAGVSVALGMDDNALADDDDMLAEIRLAHTLQRVRGEARYPRLHAAEAFGLGWRGGAKAMGAADTIGSLEAGRRGDAITIDLRALRAPFTSDDADIWDVLLARGKALHVQSVVVDGDVLLRDRVHQRLDRAALTVEVAAAGAAAIARRDPTQAAIGARIGREITRNYQAPAWRAGHR